MDIEDRGAGLTSEQWEHVRHFYGPDRPFYRYQVVVLHGYLMLCIDGIYKTLESIAEINAVHEREKEI